MTSVNLQRYTIETVCNQFIILFFWKIAKLPVERRLLQIMNFAILRLYTSTEESARSINHSSVAQDITELVGKSDGGGIGIYLNDVYYYKRSLFSVSGTSM